MDPKPFQIHRRRFLQNAAAITAATNVPAWFLELEQAHAAHPKPPGPNDRPGVALVGCGGLPSMPASFDGPHGIKAVYAGYSFAYVVPVPGGVVVVDSGP